MDTLVEKKCSSCDKSTPRVTGAVADSLRRQIPDWELRGDRLHRRYRFASFPVSVRFVAEMAQVAESEGHHPVFTVDFDKVDVEVWTHAIGGLSENDFILAAKLDRVATTM
jgi:4a-hydroxytetrahydrobiopterin dehydratase